MVTSAVVLHITVIKWFLLDFTLRYWFIILKLETARLANLVILGFSQRMQLKWLFAHILYVAHSDWR